MMTEEQYRKWLLDNNFEAKTVNRINKIRNSEPVRKARSSSRNVPGFFSSRRMGLSIQFESQLELCGVYEYEVGDSIIEFYDQADQLKLDYTQVSGKRVAFLHTPDYVVLKHGQVGYEEWKREADLEKLSREDPSRYCKDERGTWRCPPAEEAAQRLGFNYNIRTDTEVNIILQRNIRFLIEFYRQTKNRLPIDIETIILERIEKQPGIKLKELIAFCSSHSVASDHIYSLLVQGEIYVDVYRHVLSDVEYVPVYLDREIALAYETIHSTTVNHKYSTIDITVGSKIIWNGVTWTVVNPCEREVSLLHDGKVVDLPVEVMEKYLICGKMKGVSTTDPKVELLQKIHGTSKKDLATTNFRLTEVQKYLKNDKDKLVSHIRTVRDWVTKYRKSEQTLGQGYGYFGLIPKDKDKGNRNPKLPKETLELLEKAIEEDYETIKRKKRWHVHKKLEDKCESEGIIPPSYKTFTLKVNKRGKYLSTLKREGSKAAYKFEPFYFELGPTIPRHGDRPWEIGHIDHTELDIELICSITKKNLGRPWATFLIDAHSRRILAVYLTFDPPSYRSCMMVIRECVQRHSRLPETIVVDGGKEFQGVYFESLLAMYGRHKKVRPAGKPRFGSVIERLFGTTNTQFIYNLLGNTQSSKVARTQTKQVNPKLNAIWTFPKFYERLTHYCYEIYDVLEHSTLHQSPRDTYSLGMENTGQRFSSIIQYDDLFYFMTLPTTKSGHAKNEPGRGFKCNYIYYSSDALRSATHEKETVQVRYDPFNMGIAYAYIRNRWIECYSPYRYNVFYGRSEKEIQIATTIIKQKNKLKGNRNEINQKILADFLAECEEEEIVLQQLRDAELKKGIRTSKGDAVPDLTVNDSKTESLDLNKIEILEVF